MKFAILSLLAFAAPLAAQQHAFTVMDMQAMQRVMDPRVSPDGKWVAFTVRTTDVEANKSRADLWLAATDGSGARQLTGDPANDADPRWLDARTLVFMSARSGSSQLWTIGIDGGEARKLSDFPLDVENLNVIPGGRFLLSFNVWPKAKTLKESLELDAAQAKRKTSARVYDELLQRHWDSWEDGKRNHWFSWKPGEEPKDLMPGVDADAPTLPFGEIGETSVSPDGKWVAFVQRVKGRENAWHTASDVFLVPADGSAPPRNVSEKNLGYDSTPSFSPDGHTLAWLSMPRAGYEADRQQIVLMDVGSGSRRELAKDWDRSANEISWSPDGKTIFTSADNLGNVSLFAIDVMNGKVRTLVEKGRSGAPVAAGDAVVFQRDTLKSPAELFSVPAAGGEPRALTTINAERLAQVRLSDYEPYTFTGAHGDTVHGYVMKPDGFTEGRKYPTVMLIHGGPQGSFGDHFNYRWNPQAFAGAGFAVVFIDFHGSTGYGQAFCDAIRADWGGAPYEDLMKGLDAAIAKYAWMDGERVAAAGASYGGYMINWIAGQAPDRFKALVCHDGNLDERIAYFATEELWFPEWEHGIPWENPENYRKHNPIEHVQKWKTPQLVIHGARDYRVVDTGGLATFTALQRRGIPSRLVYFPDENHWVLKPQNSIEWYSQVLGWIKQWTAPEG